LLAVGRTSMRWRRTKGSRRSKCEAANERQEGKRLASSQACWTPRPGERIVEREGTKRDKGGWKIIVTIRARFRSPNQPTNQPTDVNITARFCPHFVCLLHIPCLEHLRSRRKSCLICICQWIDSMNSYWSMIFYTKTIEFIIWNNIFVYLYTHMQYKR